MIAGLKKYFKACPLLKGGKINIDSLGEAPASYSIDTLSNDTSIKKYADGGELRQYGFAFRSREPIDEVGLQNLENVQFYDHLEAWIEEQNDAGNYPEPNGDIWSKCSVQRVEPLKSGYFVNSTGTTAMYEIQLRVVYYKTK